MDVEKNGKRIVELLRAEQLPPILAEPLFIIDLNGFRKDLIRMVGLLKEIRNNKEAVDLEYAARDKRRGQVEEFIRRAGDFYNIAYDYQKHFAMREWLPTIDGKPLRFNIPSDSPFNYKTSEGALPNARMAYDSFKSRQSFFKNFLNVLYGDGEAGIRFLSRDFKSLMSDYQWIEAEAQSIQQLLKSSESKATEEKISKLKGNLHRLIGKYPATVFLSIKILLEYIKGRG